MVLQADDGGNNVESLQASVEFRDLAIDDRLRLFGFLLAIGDVRTDRLLQIVDVIDKNAIDLVRRLFNLRDEEKEATASRSARRPEAED